MNTAASGTTSVIERIFGRPLVESRKAGVRPSKDQLFFTLGGGMLRVINEKLGSNSQIQQFYRFAVNHAFKLFEEGRSMGGDEMDTEQMIKFMAKISDLRESVFVCYMVLAYPDLSKQENFGNPEVVKQIEKIRSELDSINPEEVLAFVTYCKNWWQLASKTPGLSMAHTRVVYNPKRQEIGIYNPAMRWSEEWDEEMHSLYVMGNHTSRDLANIMVERLISHLHYGKHTHEYEQVVAHQQWAVDELAKHIHTLHVLYYSHDRQPFIDQILTIERPGHKCATFELRMISAENEETVRFHLMHSIHGIEITLKRNTPSVMLRKNKAAHEVLAGRVTVDDTRL